MTTFYRNIKEQMQAVGRDQTVKASSAPLARRIDLAAKNLRARILCWWPLSFHLIYSCSPLDYVTQKEMQRWAVQFQKESLWLHQIQVGYEPVGNVKTGA